MVGNYIKYLQCPYCGGGLKISEDFLYCRDCKKVIKISDGIVVCDEKSVKGNEKMSKKAWSALYKSYKNPTDGFEEYSNSYFERTFKEINKEKKIKGSIYLEIGCGPFFFGQNIAKDCNVIIGVDNNKRALCIALTMLRKKGIKNYLLIQGDMRNLPIKNESIDIIYGGGVLEHIDNRESCLSELRRVLKKRGVSFNTVPYLNLGSLTYRQLWGNIPCLPFLKQLAEFIHIRLLRGVHMKYGYEMSFTKRYLMKLHQDAGFEKIRIERFDVLLKFDFIPKIFKKPLVWLGSHSSIFWPMVKVIAVR